MNTPLIPIKLRYIPDRSLVLWIRDLILPAGVCRFSAKNVGNLPFDPVTYLWFTGVNSIDGELVLYDALTGTERKSVDFCVKNTLLFAYINFFSYFCGLINKNNDYV